MDNQQHTNKNEWIAPEVKDLGSARNIIKDNDVDGSGVNCKINSVSILNELDLSLGNDTIKFSFGTVRIDLDSNDDLEFTVVKNDGTGLTGTVSFS